LSIVFVENETRRASGREGVWKRREQGKSIHGQAAAWNNEEDSVSPLQHKIACVVIKLCLCHRLSVRVCRKTAVRVRMRARDKRHDTHPDASNEHRHACIHTHTNIHTYISKPRGEREREIQGDKKTKNGNKTKRNDLWLVPFSSISLFAAFLCLPGVIRPLPGLLLVCLSAHTHTRIHMHSRYHACLLASRSFSLSIIPIPAISPFVLLFRCHLPQHQ